VSDPFDYPVLLRSATLGLVRDVLVETARNGLPGEHHFFLTFRTRADGVRVPPSLALLYPETMTIVLQYQFSDLIVDDEALEVTLRFGGAWERVRVPFLALTAFLDPSVPFGLDFSQFGSVSAELPRPEPVEGDRPGETVSGVLPTPGTSPAPAKGDVLPFRRR
jgi:hypothetical protein